MRLKEFKATVYEYLKFYPPIKLATYQFYPPIKLATYQSPHFAYCSLDFWFYNTIQQYSCNRVCYQSKLARSQCGVANALLL